MEIIIKIIQDNTCNGNKFRVALDYLIFSMYDREKHEKIYFKDCNNG